MFIFYLNLKQILCVERGEIIFITAVFCHVKLYSAVIIKIDTFYLNIHLKLKERKQSHYHITCGDYNVQFNISSCFPKLFFYLFFNNII